MGGIPPRQCSEDNAKGQDAVVGIQPCGHCGESGLWVAMVSCSVCVWNKEPIVIPGG